MKAEILCVGTELLLGDTVNTNAAYIARGLARAGVAVYHQSVVGDNSRRLREELERALKYSDIVITTGGLGPTYDDLTKETVAELFGKKLVTNEECLQKIRSFFERIGREMTKNNEKQAMMPEGAIVLENSNGTAPGLIVEGEGKTVILLPGPPREMAYMFDGQVVPYLMKRSNKTLVSRNIHVFGMGESKVESILREKMEKAENPTIAPYAKDGEMLLRVTASAGSAEEARALTDPVVKELCEILGDAVYGVDVVDLQHALVEELLKKGRKVATAESCTGGLVGKRITEVSGASGVFDCGVCSYANEIKEKLLGVRHETLEKFGAVSPQTAAEMAKGIRKISGADIGVSTTGIAGPQGGTPEKPVGLVYIGVDSDAMTTVVETRLSRGYPEEREMIRYLASSRALHLALQAARRF